MNETVKPAVIDDAEFLAAAEDVLREGETVADLIDRSARAEVERRREQAEFIARGLAAREEMARTGIYYTTEDVLGMMREIRDEAKGKVAKSR